MITDEHERLFRDALKLTRQAVDASIPYGYAVVMDNGDGPFVGIYRDRATAEQIRSKQPEGHRDVVVPVYR